MNYRSVLLLLSFLDSSVLFAIKPVPSFEISSHISTAYGYRISFDKGGNRGIIILQFDFDILCGRRDNKSFGIGLKSYLGTFDFDTLSFSLGAQFLFPISDILPFMISLLQLIDFSFVEDSFGIGGELQLWLGVRPHNYYFIYNHSIGIKLSLLFLSYLFKEEDKVLMISVGIDIDSFFILVYPLLYLYQRLK